MTPKAQATKQQQMQQIAICQTSVYQRTQYRLKKQPMEWEKIFANYISDGKLI